MWSMGVCLYLLLTLRQPFVGATPNDTRRMMMSGRYDSAPLSQCRSPKLSRPLAISPPRPLAPACARARVRACSLAHARAHARLKGRRAAARWRQTWWRACSS